MNKKDSSVEDTLCGRPIERVLEEITNFHGFPAPGVVIGAVMVDLAREQIGPGIEADAIVETLRCLPDAVQLFTACTLGNGWMRVLDWDRFALTLYDRATRRGCRVWLDAAKTAAHPAIHDWFLKRVPKNALPLETLLGKILEARLDAAKTAAHPAVHDWFLKRVPKDALPLETLLERILEARRAVLSCRAVIVTDFLRRPKKEAVSICPGCGEAFDPRAGDCCKGCLRGGYFKVDGA